MSQMCPDCGAAMVPMIFSSFCPNDCDRKERMERVVIVPGVPKRRIHLLSINEIMQAQPMTQLSAAIFHMEAERELADSIAAQIANEQPSEYTGVAMPFVPRRGLLTRYAKTRFRTEYYGTFSTADLSELELPEEPESVADPT